jgi:4-amino-4-deoxy-L-arabinose transferase-like glycosyltransferase
VEFLAESVGFQTSTVWSFYLVIVVFFCAWALIMLRAGMNKGKKRD